MIVVCTANRVTNALSPEATSRIRKTVREDRIDELSVGQAYRVWCVEHWRDDGLRFYLHTVQGLWWPSLYPAEFFKIQDATLPSGWQTNFKQDSNGNVLHRVSFPEWAFDDGFFERLVDQDVNACRIYDRERQRLGEV